MRNVRRIFRVVLFVIAGLYLHYTLPQHDVAKVTGISDRLERLSSFQQIFYNQVDLGSAEGDMRDLRLINTVKVDKARKKKAIMDEKIKVALAKKAANLD
mgnify:CR=1 FL=1